MRRPPPPSDADGLLNLPLGDLDVDPGERETPLVEQDLLPFEEPREDVHPGVESRSELDGSGDPVRISERLKAGLLDLGAIGAALGLAVLGSWALGVCPEVRELPAFFVFALSFSFLYTVMPLTFWGRTPGMAVMALVARGSELVPLSIQQSIRRWLAGLITLALLGLPFLIALTGRSLADRMSGSWVTRRPG